MSDTAPHTSNSHTCVWAIPGKSVTFISEADRKVFKEIMKSTNQKVSNRVIPPKVLPHFSADDPTQGQPG